MTVAELHGKISATGSNLHNRLEDLLTADIFGPLRYLPGKGIVGQLLADALCCAQTDQTLGAHPVMAQVLNGAMQVASERFRFWPRTGQTEPDLLIEWDLTSFGRFYLMLEIKYLSGKSGHGAADVGEDEKPAISDQLVLEHQDLIKLTGGHPNRGALVYLTAHRYYPTQDLDPSLSLLQRQNAGATSLYWLGWNNVYRQIQRRLDATKAPHEKDLWRDMEALLVRKDLATFRPWKDLLSDRAPIGDVAFFRRKPR